MPKTILTVNDINKKMGSYHVIKNISLSVNKGEIFGLLGPNGAGKTTLIKMIVGLYKPDSGSIVINGFNQKENFEKSLVSVGAIVESPDLYNYMSGWRNLKQFSRMYAHINDSKINNVVKMVGLSESIHKKVKTYSLGMKQRLGIAQAMLHNPNLLILDEPTNGLDPSGVQELREYLKSLAENGTSVLISSHLLSEMQNLCHRVAIIKEGKVIKVNNVEAFIDTETHYSLTTYYFDNNDHVIKATSILRNLFSDLQFEIKNNLNLSISGLDKPTLFLLNKQFIENDLEILEIINNKKTLEDKYLELTRNGGAEHEKIISSNSQ